MLAEEFQGHEGGLPAVACRVIGESELLEGGVFTDIHVGKVNDHFLAYAIVDIERVGVDRHGECAGSVLNDEALVDVARSIGAYNSACNDYMFAVLGHTYGVDVIIGTVPILCLDLGYGGVGFHGGNGDVDAGCVEVVAAGEEAQRSRNHHENQCYVSFKKFHIWD